MGILDLSGKELSKIPKSIFVFENLECLNLRDNRLKKFKTDLTPFKKLKILSLDDNKLKIVDFKVGENLKAIFLGKTNLHKEPKCVQDLIEVTVFFSNCVRVPYKDPELKRNELLALEKQYEEVFRTSEKTSYFSLSYQYRNKF